DDANRQYRDASPGAALRKMRHAAPIVSSRSIMRCLISAPAPASKHAMPGPDPAPRDCPTGADPSTFRKDRVRGDVWLARAVHSQALLNFSPGRRQEYNPLVRPVELSRPSHRLEFPGLRAGRLAP